MQAVAYTAISDNYDRPKVWSIEGAERKSYFDQQLRHWYDHPDPCRRAKYPKIMAHAVLDCDYSIWVDGSVTIDRGVRMADLVDQYLPPGIDLAIMRHPDRDCMYDEARVCTELSKDKPEVIYRYLEEMRRDNPLTMRVPPHWGLFETGVMLRRHTRGMALLNEFWWAEIVRGTRRDQISLPYVLHSTGFPYTAIPARSFYTVARHNAAHTYKRVRRGPFG